MKGIIKFKGGKLSKPKSNGKKEFTLDLTVGDSSYSFAYESEADIKAWRTLIKGNLGKEPGDVGEAKVCYRHISFFSYISDL